MSLARLEIIYQKAFQHLTAGLLITVKMLSKLVFLAISVLQNFYSLPGGQKYSQTRCYRMYEVFWLVAYSFTQVGYIAWRLSVNNPLAIQIPGSLYDVFLFLCNLSISGISLRNRRKMGSLLHAKKYLAEVTQWRRTGGFGGFILIAAYVIVVLRIVAVEYSFLNASPLALFVSFISVWLFQRLEMLLVGICWIAWELLQCHRHFNKNLQKIGHVDSLRPHIQIYIQISQAAADFNDLFGYPLMLAVFTIMCFVLVLASQIIFGRMYYYKTMGLLNILLRLLYIFPHLVSFL